MELFGADDMSYVNEIIVLLCEIDELDELVLHNLVVEVIAASEIL